jgi:hypothetical protein
MALNFILIVINWLVTLGYMYGRLSRPLFAINPKSLAKAMVLGV